MGTLVMMFEIPLPKFLIRRFINGDKKEIYAHMHTQKHTHQHRYK